MAAALESRLSPLLPSSGRLAHQADSLIAANKAARPLQDNEGFTTDNDCTVVGRTPFTLYCLLPSLQSSASAAPAGAVSLTIIHTECPSLSLVSRPQRNSGRAPQRAHRSYSAHRVSPESAWWDGGVTRDRLSVPPRCIQPAPLSPSHQPLYRI